MNANEKTRLGGKVALRRETCVETRDSRVVYQDDDPEHASLEDWHAVLATNLDGVFLGCKHAIRAMRSQGTGSIINISSRSGLVGIPAAAAYAASKAAVRNHTKTVALYCAEQGGRFVATRFIRRFSRPCGSRCWGRVRAANEHA